LTPEPGVYAKRMLKTVKPYRYAEKAVPMIRKWLTTMVIPEIQRQLSAGVGG